MIPTIATEIEKRYEKRFPGNPATLFTPQDETRTTFERLLEKAIKEGKPLTEDDIINFYGKKGYTFRKEYLDDWWEVCGMEPISWK